MMHLVFIGQGQVGALKTWTAGLSGPMSPDKPESMDDGNSNDIKHQSIYNRFKRRWASFAFGMDWFHSV